MLVHTKSPSPCRAVHFTESDHVHCLRDNSAYKDVKFDSDKHTGRTYLFSHNTNIMPYFELCELLLQLYNVGRRTLKKFGVSADTDEGLAKFADLFTG